MAAQGEASKTDVIDEVARHLHDKLPPDEADLIERFTRRLYADLAPEDAEERSVYDLYGAAMTLWSLTARRGPGETKVRLYSPRLEGYGWDCRHTVLQIVCDDMPFLVDSVTMELHRHGLATHLLLHPVIKVRRDPQGNLSEVRGLDDPADAPAESLIHIELDRQTDPTVLRQLKHDIVKVLGDVRAAVEDWQPMREELQRVVQELTEHPPPVDPEELSEAVDFLRWLDDNHFTFLGYRSYDLAVEDDGSVALRSVPDSGLGILRPGLRPVADPDGGRDRGVAPPAGRAADPEGGHGHGESEPGAPTVRRLTGEAAELARAPHVLVLTKANSRSTVHVPSYLDYVGVRRFDDAGEVVGEWRFLGLYTSVVYNNTPRDVPVLRRRIRRVLELAGFAPHSHNEKALLDVLETHPRDELLQTGSEELYEIARGILRLKDRRRVALFVRPDPYRRFLSCLVYVPRERYNTTVRQRIEAVLTSAFNGAVIDYSLRIAESDLARLHVIVRTRAGRPSAVDLAEVQQRLVRACRSWADDLRDALLESCEEEHGTRLFRAYEDAFPAAYREDFPARNAVADILKIEELEATDPGDPDAIPAMSLYQPLEASAGSLRFKLFWRSSGTAGRRVRGSDPEGGRPGAGGAPLLSDVLPVLESMGVKVVDERPYELRTQRGSSYRIQDFGLVVETRRGWEPDVGDVTTLFQEAFARVWHGEAASDGFNRLVLGAGLTWREVSVIRAYAKYLRQAGSTFSQSYMERTLAANPEIASLLIELFKARFDPGRDEAGRAAAGEVTKLIEAALDEVSSLDQDRILRGFLTVVNATVRTNYYQRTREGQPKPTLSLKLDPTRIPFLPEPRPAVETFVYSPRVEGVHLRAARVARGGIRWSDREEDYRTEVLGLMRAQTVKNAVIVPSGAKGGFVVKRPPQGADRERLAEEVRACYAAFIRGLLDVTDNYLPDPDPTDDVPAELVSPPDLVRHDGPDPYLVVAADKGTAAFSDLANEIAAEYGYWLGDAFASGGSAGYDHKRMGITARGAWESVRWHFHEMGVDPQTEDFTCIGIGDMSGDVFGNGMLQSRHTRLVAAFNHQHIFIDPDPDPEVGYAERQRLFALPRSTWADYDPSKLSPGGGVYERTAKSITLGEQARRALAVEQEAFTPQELIRAVLLAPADLLFNGGIGTYVKATGETHADVGDRANDAVRVNGAELRCRVVCEGGNLGLTQLGRIEYALAGGRVNTDFIDNSAGVDTSDQEVNIKILLGDVVTVGDLTVKQRNELLAGMTDQVTALVLRDSYRQAECLSVSESSAAKLLEQHAHLVRGMERAGTLNRALEHLPDRKALAERRAAGKGLTRPELAVLLAHGKIAMQRELLASDAVDDPFLFGELERHLPEPLRRFGEHLRRHRLRREIIATRLTNSMLNRGGPAFAFMVGEETGAAPPDIAMAYAVAREVFSLRQLWTDIEALDRGGPTGRRVRGFDPEVGPFAESAGGLRGGGRTEGRSVGGGGERRIHANVQIGMLREGRRLTERATAWLLRNRRLPLDVAAEVAALTPVAAEVGEQLPKLLVGSAAELFSQRVDRLVAQGVPEPLARRVAGLGAWLSTLDISAVAARLGAAVHDVAAVYFHINARLEIDWLRRQVPDDPGRSESHWHQLAWASLREDLNVQHRTITARVLEAAAQGAQAGDPAALVDAWVSENQTPVQRCLTTISDLKSSDTIDLAMASVGLRELRRLAQTTAPTPGSGL